MRRVLIFNFFSGVKERGIPLYASELSACMRRLGVDHVELTCPAGLRRLHPTFQNVCFVFFEQLVAPIIAGIQRCSVVIYPYNSCGIVDALLGRSILVVHDLIPNARPQRQALASMYIRLTQAVHCSLRRPVCTGSLHTLRMLRRLPLFSRGPMYLWSNSFHAFEDVAQAIAGEGRCERKTQSVLLCTGAGKNKDLAGAIRMFEASAMQHRAELRIVGLGDDAPLHQRRVDHWLGVSAGRVTVLGKLSLADIAREYRDADVVWVHSLKEGFGRPIVEARIMGRPVLANNIGAFRRLTELGHLSVYDQSSFEAHLTSLLDQRGAPSPEQLSSVHINRQLESSVLEVLDRHLPRA
jgi:glycosyltransferase involved in cell wall biosynthesis